MPWLFDCRWLLLPGVLLLGACGDKSARAANTAWPSKLRYLVSISDEDPAVEATRLAAIGTYLESQLHIPVEVVGNSGYGAAIEAMRAHKIEASTFGPFSYLIAAEKAGAEVIASRGSLEGAPSRYSGGLAVAANSPLHSIDDLAQHASELTVSFVDPASASGNLVQRGYLASVGIDPERDFKRVTYTQTHPTGALMLLSGKTDIAAIGEKIVPALELTGSVPRGTIRYLWISPSIPEGPVAVRKDLPEDFKRALQTALVGMQANAPDAYRNMSAKIFFERFKNTALVPATDADFDPLRALVRSLDEKQLLE